MLVLSVSLQIPMRLLRQQRILRRTRQSQLLSLSTRAQAQGRPKSSPNLVFLHCQEQTHAAQRKRAAAARHEKSEGQFAKRNQQMRNGNSVMPASCGICCRDIFPDALPSAKINNICRSTQRRPLCFLGSVRSCRLRPTRYITEP